MPLQDFQDPQNSSALYFDSSCFRSDFGISIFSTFSITFVFLFPVFFLVLYLGCQRWRSRRSRFNSDLFTNHSMAMTLNEFLGLVLYFSGGFHRVTALLEVGICMWMVTSVGQILFHLLTCVERYLAVVHPVTYLELRKPLGVRIRNFVVGCVWLLSFGWLIILYHTSSRFYSIFYTCILVFFITVVSVCSVFVLCALNRQGPREAVGKRDQADRSKQRAFCAIIAILGVLMLRFFSNLAVTVTHWRASPDPRHLCAVMLCGFWLDLPSTLVLPLLFLRRAETLNCCHGNAQHPKQ